MATLGGCAGGSRTVRANQEPGAVDWTLDRSPARVALVLSSGGLRGLAHVGVLRVLEANGMHPDLIVGSSVGAVAGVIYAAGVSGDELVGRDVPDVLDPWGTWLVSPSQRRDALENFIAGLVRERRIEDLPIRFVAVATERNTGCIALFDRGDAARAVAASSALPGALAPVRIGGLSFSDGGLGAPLPVRLARALGALRVVAVDTTFHAEPEVPAGVFDSVFHAGMVMSRHLAQPDRAEADVLIEPRLPPVAEVTLANRMALVQASERAAFAQLERLRRVFSLADYPRHPTASGSLPLCDPALVRSGLKNNARRDREISPRNGAR